jgi:tRNA(Ile)-lysidine synthase
MVYKTFKKTVARHDLLGPGDRVLVAFSGGQDSSALLELLLRLRDEVPIEIRLAHFNHKLRPSADADEAHAKAVARKFKLAIVTGSRNVRLYARRRRLNLEEAARTLRHGFLKKTARRTGATKIATGHTLTDQAETVLMRLMRGTGPQGLGGMAPKPDAILIRPLLDLERREITAYLGLRGVPFRSDETNFDRRYLRNRIRLDVLPSLEAVEPAVVRHLGRLAMIMRDEERLLERVTATAWHELLRIEGGRPALDAGGLTTLPHGLSRRVVRKFLSDLCGNLRGISFEDVESILGLKNGKEKTVRKGLVLRREAGLLFRKRSRPDGKAFEVRWDGNAALKLRGTEWKFRASTIKHEPPGKLSFDDRHKAYLDKSRLEFPLIVRSRRPGDRYRPLGAPGSKKLKEMLRAKGIPLATRDTVPVFVSAGRIVWVPGLPVSEEHKVTGSTKTLFVIEKKDKSDNFPSRSRRQAGPRAGG